MRVVHWRFTYILAAVWLFFCSKESGPAADQANRTAPTLTQAAAEGGNTNTRQGSPKKRALLVGINNYKYSDKIPSLSGSINDVEDMRTLLIGKFEFPPENILVLQDAAATHAGIIGAIQTHLIAKTQPGDIVVFHYSGHGSQMPDVTKKRISGLDETIVPYDARDEAGKVFDISGAELHGLLLQLAAKTKNITFILDSCHSGTLVRDGAPARTRWIKADLRDPPPLPPYAVTTRGLGQTEETLSPRYAFIAAATSKESAFEYFSEGKDHGALTYFLTRQLRTANAAATYRDVMDSVTGNVTSNYPSQHPSLEGVEADQYVFGDGSSLAQMYVAASPLDPNKVSIAVGQVQGATIGSTYEVYAPETKKFTPPAKPVAVVQLTSVGAFTSEGKIVSGTKIAPFSRAVERVHWYGKSKLRVFMVGLDKSPTLQSIKAAFDPLKYIEVVNQPWACNMQLRERNSKIETLGADLTTLSTPVAVDEPKVVDRIVGQIRSWAKWFNVLTIHNLQTEIDLQFSIKASQTRDPLARVGKPDAGILEGEKVDATVQNKSAKDLYIAMIDIQSDGTISRMYPEAEGAVEVLKPGSTLQRSFKGTVPKGRSVSTDVVKVFASYKPIDIRPLLEEKIKDPDFKIPSDPLNELLADAGGLSRGLEPVLDKPVNLGGWTATQRVVVVRLKK
jgi:hypothetical protein